MNGDDPHVHERQGILTRLLDAVKQCQVRFGGRTELAADADSRVSCLCAAWEVALQHGIKKNSKALLALKQVTEITGLNKVTDMFSDIANKETEPVFWQYVKEHLTKHEQDRFHTLKNISTDVGRGRAWMRASLNEHSLERYMHMLLENEEMMRQHYEPWSFLRDQEKSSMMPMMAAGLGSILFAISIDNPDLNLSRKPTSTTINITNTSKPVVARMENEPRPVIAGEESPKPAPSEGKKKEKKKKKKSANIVSFDEEDEEGHIYTSKESSHDFKHSVEQLHVDNSLLGKGTILEEENDSFEQAAQKNVHLDLNGAISSEKFQKNTLMTREPSINSGGSYDRPISVSSMSSTDFDIGETLVPLSSDGRPISSAVRTTVGSEILGTSADSSESPRMARYSGVDIESAALALDMVQRGTNQSYRTSGDGVNMEEVINKDSMSSNELKQAVIAMMVKKDEVEEQNRNIQAMLQQEMETSSSLRAEIEDMKQLHAAKLEKEQSKYQTIQKENELLKHQLRRYVNAVQMLRAEGSQVDENLGIHLDEPQPNIPPAKPNIDYSHEASEYEKKLIQVAEMHGELMEFNELLHKQIHSKEALVRRLQQELIDLRGPLPQDLQLATDDGGVTDVESATLRARTLINIWIPAAFLQGSGSDVHHVYQIYVRIKDEEWNIYKRYSQFYELHVKLKKMFPRVGKYEFPPKKTIGKKDAKVVESRRCVFQSYLRHVINYILDNDKTLCARINKEMLVDMLQFFSDKPLEKGLKKKKMNKVSSAPALSSSPQREQVAQQPQYTGL